MLLGLVVDDADERDVRVVKEEAVTEEEVRNNTLRVKRGVPVKRLREKQRSELMEVCLSLFCLNLGCQHGGAQHFLKMMFGLEST